MDRLSTLKLLVSAVDAGSISRAARRHGLSTTSASRRLMELEQELGVRLLDRTTRYVAPTEAGRRLRDRVAPMIAGLDLALREAGEDPQVPSGTLRIFARRSFAMLHVAPLLPGFLAAHPRLGVDLHLTETVEIAPGEEVDLVIRLGAPAEKTLVSHVLASGRRILAASPDYLERAGTPQEIEDLRAHDCLTYRRAEADPSWVFETPSGRRELVVRGPLRATSGEVLREAAVAGLGLVLLPAWMIADEIAAGRLVACLQETPAWPAGFDRKIVAVHRRVDPLPAKIAAFLAFIAGRCFEGSRMREGRHHFPGLRENISRKIPLPRNVGDGQCTGHHMREDAMVTITPLHPLFAAEVKGLDLSDRLDPGVLGEIKDAFARHSVLVFRDQHVTDEQQIAFSREFGELETTKVGTPGAGSNLVVLTNIGPDGEIQPPTNSQMLNNKANQQWHADSSFKPVPARASMLSARIIPSAGGNTEYISMRAVYAALPDELKRAVEGRVAIHDYAFGRSKIDPNLVSGEERAAVPPVRQAMVLDHGPDGRSLYLGAHCAFVEGMGEAEGRALIDRLMEFATQARFIYSHPWRSHDMILWDNRAVLHRATPFASTAERRLMVRTTIAGDGPTVAAMAA